MAKLGYTFYVKDWRTDDDVFELSLAEKGFFRELIDECFMQNSQNICIKIPTFCRKHGINRRTFAKLLQNLSETSLIVLINDDGSEIEIPSVSKRLGVIEKAINGGKKSTRKGIKNAENDEKKVAKENINRIEVERGINKIFDDFVKEVKDKQHQAIIEQWYISLKIKKGALTPILKGFKVQLLTDSKVHKNTHEFRKHFYNYLNRLDAIGKLNEYKHQKTL